MKKSIKKALSYIVPKGDLKEKLKLIYYSFNKPSQVEFSLVSNGNNVAYKTYYNDLSLITNEALYTIFPDFDYYQHFYKVKKGDVVIDAGANCGHLSIFFSKSVGAGGQIYAFEPDKFNIERIQKNISLNVGLPANIKIEDLLLWNENTLVDFFEAGTVGSSAVWIPDAEKCVKKQAVTIDDWVLKNNIDKIDFIKMDIEGAELEAIYGCEAVIKKYAPNFAIASYHMVDGQPTYIELERFF